MRIRGAKTELEEAGLETEGMAETTASLREQLLAVADVDILKDPNTFKSTYQILDELSQHWQNLSDVEQAALTEVLAGDIRLPECAVMHNRTYLTAGNALEPCTTITEKSRYDGLKTQGLAVHATKYPNVIISQNNRQDEGKCSTTIPHKGFENKIRVGNPEYSNHKKHGANKGVGEIPLNGKGMLLLVG